MTLKERDYLLTVRSRPVMLLLVANIQARLLDAGNPDAKNAISFLPRKAPSRGNISWIHFEEFPLSSCMAFETDIVADKLRRT